MVTWTVCITIISNGDLLAFDALFELKLKLQEKYKPADSWDFLKYDDGFALKFELDESYIQMGACLKVKGEKIYILDNNLHKLMVFKKSGEYIGKLGIKGRGPGDIYYPMWFEFYKDKIYIVNNNGIDIFNVDDLKFSRRIRTFFFSFRFAVADDKIYTVQTASYHGKHPVFLQLNMKGAVENTFSDKEFEKSNLKYDKSGDVFYLKHQAIFVPKNQNLLYFFDNSGKLNKKIRINYPFLDEIEEWNEKQNSNSSRKRMSYWFSNMFSSAKTFRGDIYLLLKIPRLEILRIDTKGNMKGHFYNNDDFRYMRWYDFDIVEEEGKMIFYLLGHSDGKEKKRDMIDFGVYRMIPPGSTAGHGKTGESIKNK